MGAAGGGGVGWEGAEKIGLRNFANFATSLHNGAYASFLLVAGELLYLGRILNSSAGGLVCQ